MFKTSVASISARAEIAYAGADRCDMRMRPIFVRENMDSFLSRVVLALATIRLRNIRIKLFFSTETMSSIDRVKRSRIRTRQRDGFRATVGRKKKKKKIYSENVSKKRASLNRSARLPTKNADRRAIAAIDSWRRLRRRGRNCRRAARTCRGFRR